MERTGSTIRAVLTSPCNFGTCTCNGLEVRFQSLEQVIVPNMPRPDYKSQRFLVFLGLSSLSFMIQWAAIFSMSLFNQYSIPHSANFRWGSYALNPLFAPQLPPETL